MVLWYMPSHFLFICEERIFPYLHLLIPPPLLFAYSLGNRHLSMARHGCTTKLKSFRSHLVQAPYKALYLIFSYFFKKRTPTLCKRPVHKSRVHSWVKLTSRPVTFAAGLNNICVIFCIVLIAWQLTIGSLLITEMTKNINLIPFLPLALLSTP